MKIPYHRSSLGLLGFLASCTATDFPLRAQFSQATEVTPPPEVEAHAQLSETRPDNVPESASNLILANYGSGSTLLRALAATTESDFRAISANARSERGGGPTGSWALPPLRRR